MLKITTAKIFSHRFLLARNKTALTELKSVANGLNTQWRRKSYAASVPSDAPKPQRGRKKVSKDERKAMVEAFVKTYRAAHDGKSPTTSDVRKNVGGCFYVLRIILQELECKSKISSPDGGGLIKVHNVSVDVRTQNEGDNLAGDNVKIGDASDKHLEAGPSASSTAEINFFEEVKKTTASFGQPELFGIESNVINGNSEVVTCSHLGKSEHEKMEGARENHLDFVKRESCSVKEETNKTFHQGHNTAENGKKEEAEGVHSNFVPSKSHLLKREPEKVPHPSVGNADEKEERVPSKNLLESDGTKQEAKQYQGSPEPQNDITNIAGRQTNDAEVPKKSTVWGNLKSLADSFFRMWK